MTHKISIANVALGGDAPLAFIAGHCVVENAESALEVAGQLQDIFSPRGVPWIFKASFDKANRSSIDSYRGPGMEEGLAALAAVKKEVGVPVLTDVHEPDQCVRVAEVVDVLQIPAFLCRQTDLLVAAARTGKPVNIKKGQFLAPWDMKSIVAKIAPDITQAVSITERGSSFGYNNLVVDMRSLLWLRELGYPVVYDATHSMQLPGGGGDKTDGLAELIVPVARGAVAIGVDAVFMEVHADPSQALSDGKNTLPLDQVPALVDALVALDRVRREVGAEPG